MQVQTERFGTIDIPEDDVIAFPSGLVGFAGENRFVLLRTREGSAVAWLQSVATVWLALPVVSIESLDGVDLSELPIALAIREANLGSESDEYAVMAVLNAPGGGVPATVNLLAPIIVNAESRKGAQVLIEKSRYSTREPFVLRNQPTGVEQPAESGTTEASGLTAAR